MKGGNLVPSVAGKRILPQVLFNLKVPFPGTEVN